MKNLLTAIRNHMYVIAALCLAAAFFFCAAPVTANAATTLTANKAITVKSKADEVKTFTFKAPKSGYFYLTIAPTKAYYESGEQITASSGTQPYVTVDLKIGNNTIYGSYQVMYNSSSKKTCKMAAAPGQKVTVTVTANNTWVGGVGKMNYKLKMTTGTYKNMETENNNAKKYADPIKVNTTYNGLLHTGDKDWYVFTAPKTGYYKVYGCNKDTTTGSYATVYDSKVYQGSKLLGNIGLRTGAGSTLMTDNAKVKLKKGQKLYILIDFNSTVQMQFFTDEMTYHYSLVVKSVS